MPEKVRDWNKLGEAQRKRYLGAGRTGSLTGTAGLSPSQVRSWYERGGDLSSGRGHATTPRQFRSTVRRVASGEGTTDDLKQLKKWRQSNARPAWIPKGSEDVRDDTAALLSLIPTSPKYWKSVNITPEGDGFIMAVTTKRGVVYSIMLPDRDSVSEVATLLSSREYLATNIKERRIMESVWNTVGGDAVAIDVRLVGTDVRSKDNTKEPKQTTKKALRK